MTTRLHDMTELEKALLGNNKDVSFYLEMVEVDAFQSDIQKLIEKHQRTDVKELKEKIKAAVDAA